MNEEVACEMIKHIAAVWAEELVSRRFLVVFGSEKHHYEQLTIMKHHLLHLTGVSTQLSADDFFQKAADGSLQPTQFSISESAMKDKLLPLYRSPNFLLSANKIGKSRENRIYLSFAFALGPTPCLVFSKEGGQRIAFPKSMMNIPLVKLTKDIQDIKAVFWKPIASKEPYSAENQVVIRNGFAREQFPFPILA